MLQSVIEGGSRSSIFPLSWLPCNGRTRSRASPEILAVIGPVNWLLSKYSSSKFVNFFKSGIGPDNLLVPKFRIHSVFSAHKSGIDPFNPTTHSTRAPVTLPSAVQLKLGCAVGKPAVRLQQAPLVHLYARPDWSYSCSNGEQSWDCVCARAFRTRRRWIRK
ncbi:hypothetical protein M427DRAFT_399640 [Gonapodya prolifera JEL478]|uniref:Uncharacterized protein n=1 Tax=Gonapodya prolifera (strain JEL478) TaxID=1344416 RepID=A0A139ATT6_GONPJ|nr:hypothetical protein M427DRAFT_399640 [Gonapodya prolifera JEL478]|eukprot:KXS19993.1 hypothetical protein M427DRAFT_399640 [Gonapodya prolifera JEL478]